MMQPVPDEPDGDSWGAAVAGYPCGAFVRSVADDGVFVHVGSTGVIVGRTFPRRSSFQEMLLEILWSDETQSHVPYEQVVRIYDKETA